MSDYTTKPIIFRIVDEDHGDDSPWCLDAVDADGGFTEWIERYPSKAVAIARLPEAVVELRDLLGVELDPTVVLVQSGETWVRVHAQAWLTVEQTCDVCGLYAPFCVGGEDYYCAEHQPEPDVFVVYDEAEHGQIDPEDHLYERGAGK